MKTIYTNEHRHQDGKLELIDGKFMPAFEMPRRAQIVIDRVKAEKLGPIQPPEEFGLEPVKRIHDKGFVEFLRTAWDEWVQTGPKATSFIRYFISSYAYSPAGR